MDDSPLISRSRRRQVAIAAAAESAVAALAPALAVVTGVTMPRPLRSQDSQDTGNINDLQMPHSRPSSTATAMPAEDESEESGELASSMSAESADTSAATGPAVFTPEGSRPFSGVQGVGVHDVHMLPSLIPGTAMAARAATSQTAATAVSSAVLQMSFTTTAAMATSSVVTPWQLGGLEDSIQPDSDTARSWRQQMLLGSLAVAADGSLQPVLTSAASSTTSGHLPLGHQRI
jgi:hypothetical protein